MSPSRPAPGPSGAAGRGHLATQRALAATRAAARDGADALLVHVPVVGDRGVQRLLDSWVEQAADTLRAISEAAEERLLDLGGPEQAADQGRPPRPTAPSAGSPAASAGAGPGATAPGPPYRGARG